ncbi:unnamed protein product [Arctia plantaginis]|uniref:Inosine/uridine-preferring nucleoside hydrolase domain-containing protein n=1 Tax=Arctia plantaginis TaxID=874455 RepID=A0A8S1AHH1_ARCPL|nr:unnamed protein product [Arctia plantaginis]
MSPTKKVFTYIGAILILILLLTGWTLFFLSRRNDTKNNPELHGDMGRNWHNQPAPLRAGPKRCTAQDYICCHAETGPNPSEKGLKLVIDHDGGADDALAITMSILFEKYFNGPKIAALTTTYGNINQSQAIVNSARILKLCNRSDIPIYAGAKHALISGIESDFFFGFDGLGDDGYVAMEPIAIESVNAAVGLINLSKKYEGDLVIMAIGPLTNIALAITMDPDFIGRLSQLYVGAGHIYSESFPEPEFNAAMDPEAYYILADNARVDKVTIIPYSQVYVSLNATKKWRVNVLGAIDSPIIKALNGYERVSLASPGRVWSLLDPAVAAMALDNSIIKEYRNTDNGIILCGDKRGVNTNNFTSKNPNSRLVYTAFVKKYKKFLFDVYSASSCSIKHS